MSIRAMTTALRLFCAASLPRVFFAALLLGLAAPQAVLAQASSPTLDTMRKRGILNCGVNTGLAGFAAPDGRGRWIGIDADFCRAVAAAVFGDGDKVRFVPLNAKERFTALQSGEVDMLSRNTTWTMSRDTSLGLNFAGVLFYDGQAFMVRKSQKLKSVDELAGASICVQTGTTNELNLADYFETRGLTYKPVVFERLIEVLAAYQSNRCDAFTTDSSQLVAERTRLADPENHDILPDLISKEPLGPLVRQGDAVWSNVVRWTLFLLINAEELGITQETVGEAQTSSSPEIRRIFGPGSTFGRALGLKDDWAVSVIRTVGNYGESFERNLGQGSPLRIERGRNALWTEGGLMYAPPIR
ncbi:MAG TPA: amino acid ABC transporter substrate-binding protein [Hyphomicrobium sp.]|nr:amino acid ABC transporter substrate-binding protein [Hyphomicrobium sp.]